MKQFENLSKEIGNAMNLLKKEKFAFAGIRRYIRLDDEMALIDKEEADNAFKKYKKEIIDKLLLNNGFYKWKSSAYVRLNGIGLLEYIDLQKERYGSKTFCVNFSIMPLYCEEPYMVTGLGYRLGTYICGKDVWWDYGSERVARESFENVSEAITQFIFPWFFELSTEENYKKRLIEDSAKKFAGYHVSQWLEALTVEDKEHLMQESINRLKLPKKLLKI